MESYIEIKNLSKKIKKNTVLNNINLELQKGKIYGFRGINGSGKTMLFRAICGLITPTEGEIIINNKILHKDISFPESVGILIENPGFLPNYSGKKNLKLLADIKGIIREGEIDKILNLVGLDCNDTRKYKQYSLGMKQKLGIAQVLMENPDLILLDEPTNALDEKSVQNVLGIIYEEKQKGKTILIASHDNYTLEKISDEIINIENGKII
ncbi:ABC transporter,Methionine import ATP-binding protein MetN 2,cytochrome c biogenesis protein CcmA,ABC-type Na+ transport system, ATPase component,lantibiotic protection ABC transporter, ATP-binding subunit,ABC transporter [[Clostridium] sordellii]|uniref:ABC transporter ATP-binding protein n=1 Tax=Paraclostridium sordellii TaxID=1505 RepID=UPI000541F38B|nr:ATP-binding cassette domain-containing protein [Paeniclostridium sordellii]CEK36218.1 ABC transporter,Methionine import ATP-binding protein MetN 2,cytochrome c biogenesis protein CcmA,ABC-type Na+ transport system, ATPase component,lantibiotic protection ABC transporter, ATP-binding subunit,ABC transporter [[Clostridium] sordellii] [Paeniclostridium sordellii]